MASERESRNQAFILWCLTAAIVLGILNALALSRSGHWSCPPLPHGDGPDYESIGYSIARGEGFQFAWDDPDWQSPYRTSEHASEYSQFERKDWPGETTSRPPALPWLIAVVYRSFGRNPMAFAAIRSLALLALTSAGIIAIALARSWTEQLRINGRSIRGPGIHIAALVALSLAAADRTVKQYTQDFLTEPWALLLLTVLAWILTRWSQNPRDSRWGMWGGFLFGWMVLFRSLFIVWLPFLLIGLVWISRTAPTPKNGSDELSDSEPQTEQVQSRFERGTWQPIAAFVICFLLLVGPWWIRNCWVAESFLPLGGQGAASLRGGYSDEALADWGNWHPEAEIAMQNSLDQRPESLRWTAANREVALAALATQQTSEWVANHSIHLPELIAKRWISHWGPWRIDHLIWKLLAWTGLGSLFIANRRLGIALATLLVADSLSIAMLYETGGRFLIPLHAVLYALAAVGVVSITARIWPQRLSCVEA